MTVRILIVEDEAPIAELVELYLGKEGFRTEVAIDGPSAVQAFERERFELVILDLMLPGGMDGLEVCRALRSKGDVPVIMLTAKDDEIDRVLGLEIGADDYVTKPFSPRELVARVKAVLRRTSSSPNPDAADVLKLAELTIDVPRREVRIGEEGVELTAREFDLLEFLVRNRGIVFSRQRLLEQVWGYERVVDTRTVDSHVKSLRAKLGPRADLIKTVRGVGYKAES